VKYGENVVCAFVKSGEVEGKLNDCEATAEAGYHCDVMKIRQE